MALGEKLKEILVNRNITVKDFADNIGVAPTTLYSFIKRDSDTGKLDLINKISKGLDMSIEDFLRLDYEYQGKIYMPDGSAKGFYAPDQKNMNNDIQIKDLKNEIHSMSKEELIALIRQSKEMLDSMHELNEDGQQKVKEYASDLSENPKYRKDTAESDQQP